MKKLNRKIIGRVCVGIVLLALVLWLMPLPLPFHISLSGVRVEDSTAAEPAALEAKGWRLCRFLRRTELRASFTVETARPPFSKSWTMGRISSSCSLQTGVSRRKRWISCA